MTKKHAIGRLFPAFLFTNLGFAWCYFWRFDPVLFAIAAAIAACASSWLVVTIVEVARMLTVAPECLSTDVASGAGAAEDVL